jgi:hypothetical protein
MAVGVSTATSGEGSTKAKNTMVVTLAARNEAHAAVNTRRMLWESSGLALVSLRDTGCSHTQDVGGQQLDAQFTQTLTLCRHIILTACGNGRANGIG